MDADDQDKLNPEPEIEPDSDSESKLEIEPEGESEPDEAETSIEIAPPADSAPLPAAPPRIVAETPVGGKARPAPAPRRDISPPPSAEKEQPSEIQEAVELPSPETEALAASPVSEAELSAAEPAPALLESAEVPPAEPAPAFPESAEATPAETEATPQEPPAPARTVVPSVVSTSEVDAAKADDWDDDISPELAALLFSPKKRDAAPREEVKGAVSPAAEIAPAAESTPAAEPIQLIRIEEARILPITAEGVSSPPPQIQPEGKARYQRTEEPLDDDAGQRTEEQWDFRGPDYPMVGGRAVKRIAINETAYADGSWHWDFERSYVDGGTDSREVRANTDHSYIERRDAIRSKDSTTGKQVMRKETEAMILAGPPREEKRGLLSSLLGRGDDENGPKAWRAASSHEAGRARKDGGMAFGRKLLGLF